MWLRAYIVYVPQEARYTGDKEDCQDAMDDDVKGCN